MKMQKVKLGDILDLQPKSKIKAGEGTMNGKYPFFTSSKIQDKFINVADYHYPSLIFGTGGDASVHFCNTDFSTSTDCLVFILRNNYNANLKYVYYYLFENIDLIKAGFKGCGLKHISRNYILDIEIDLPHIDQQDKLVYMLDCICSLGEKRKEQIKKLDLLIKSRFIEMFGAPLSDEYTTPFINACTFNPKKTEKKDWADNLLVSFVPMPLVSEQGQIQTNNIKLYSDVKKGFTYFRENDVLFAKITPCMENGKGAIAINLQNGIGFGSTEFHVLRPIENISNPYWIYYLTAIDSFRIMAEKKMTGSAGQKRVPISFFENLKVNLPPIELQNEFAEFVKLIDKSKFRWQKSLEELESLKKSLMQQYFG